MLRFPSPRFTALSSLFLWLMAATGYAQVNITLTVYEVSTQIGDCDPLLGGMSDPVWHWSGANVTPQCMMSTCDGCTLTASLSLMNGTYTCLADVPDTLTVNWGACEEDGAGCSGGTFAGLCDGGNATRTDTLYIPLATGIYDLGLLSAASTSLSCPGAFGYRLRWDITVGAGTGYFQSDTVIISAGSNYTFPDGSTLTNVQQSLIHNSPLLAVSGCDSVLQTVLIVPGIPLVVQHGPVLNAARYFSGMQYQWLDCQNGYAPVPGANGPSFIPPAPGTYALRTAAGTYADTSACTSFVIVRSETPLPTPEMRIHPNPFTDQITLTAPEPIQHLTLSSTDGRVLREMTLPIPQTETRLLLPDLPHGIYLLHCTTDRGTYVQRVVR